VFARPVGAGGGGVGDGRGGGGGPGRRPLRTGATILGALAVAASVLVVVGLVIDRWEWQELAVVAAGYGDGYPRSSRAGTKCTCSRR